MTVSSTSPLGILVPLAQEAEALFALMKQDGATHTQRIGGRDYHSGHLFGRPCVLTLSRVGKVAAATAAAGLIHAYKVGAILNVGVAGGAAATVKVGDIVVADAMLQHDLDARPIFPRYEVPLTGMSRFAADAAIGNSLSQAIEAFLAEDLPQLSAEIRERFALAAPRLHRGLIISGDQFVNGHAAVAALRDDIPDALAIEMESGAVAQICHDYGIPCGVLRTISDSADDNAHVDFPAFLATVASFYSHHILRRFLQRTDW
ncbi:5'-methylthioadenosine/adenosylhomocysteine nucleosidase [Labrys sp. LIt4]|uniref:5'-methylthioadenosine/adenosylhomocysteine nucleosidase n=1 Tax=Labrys sp. LIt4 TaxID=2821355 RepID=UPI001AE0DF94|nr:5'-methylthioadenosine/adenosylhomocysteine nucleosidase [Labrys sp. LIt4]MBP0578079.1 5'-methylthioadenosine/adenosylhomocysteine nucleosidase [Labrys sp. LIt4]